MATAHAWLHSRIRDSQELFEIPQNILFISYGLLGIVFILLEYNFTHKKIVIAGFSVKSIDYMGRKKTSFFRVEDGDWEIKEN